MEKRRCLIHIRIASNHSKSGMWYMYLEAQKTESQNFKKVWLANVCHKNIGFLSNTGPDPLKNQKATKPALNVGPSLVRKWNAIYMKLCWWANDDQLLMVFGSGHQVKNKNRKRQDFEKKQQQKPMDSLKNINSGEFPPNKINRYLHISRLAFTFWGSAVAQW